MTQNRNSHGDSNSGRGDVNASGNSRRAFATMFGALGAYALTACAGDSRAPRTGANRTPVDDLVERHSALMGPGTVKIAQTLQELRLLDPTAVTEACVAVLYGVHVPGDGGGGLFYWSGLPAKDDGGVVVNPAVTGVTSEAIAGWRRILDTTVTPEMFGARGEDDSVDGKALRAALKTGLEVRCKPGRIYHCDASPDDSNACLVLQSGSHLNLNGATIKSVSAGSPFVITANGSAETPALAITVRDGTIDGGYYSVDAQGSPACPAATTTLAAAVHLPYVRDLLLDDLVIQNALGTGLYCTTNFQQGSTVRNRIGRLQVKNVAGAGVHVDGEAWTIGDVQVLNTKHCPGAIGSGWEGNPFIANLRKSTIGRIYAERFGFGIKFQGSCIDLSIGEIVAIGSNNVELDPLIKFEGDAVSGNQRVSVGSIIASGGLGNGLYVINTRDLSISSYTGTGNGRSRTGQYPPTDHDITADILVYDSAVSISSATIREANGAGLRYTMSSTPTLAPVLQIGTLSFDCSTSAHLFPVYAGAGRLSIDHLYVRRSGQQGGVALVYVDGQRPGTGLGCYTPDYVHVKTLVADLEIDRYVTSAWPLFQVPTPTMNAVEVENFVLAGHRRSETVELRPGTQTAYSNLGMSRYGDMYTAILDVVPVNAAARNLFGQLAGCAYELVDTATGSYGGYVLHHPVVPAGVTCLVRVTLRGYTCRC